MLGETPVLILAGGLGTRLRPVLADRPKGLAPVAGRAFLEIQIELLRACGARQFVLCVGHRADQIRAALGDGSALGVRVDYSVEGERLLGTAGALKLAERFFRPRALVLNGDTYLAADYDRLVRNHGEENVRSGALATVALARAPDATRFGTVLLDPAGRYLTGFREKEAAAGGEGWRNAGAYVVERALLDHIPAGTPTSLERETFPEVLRAGGKVAAAACAEPFYDIGTPQDWARFAERYTGRDLGPVRRAG
jgi:NDP-sugar pyrophosphorylase family protein